MCRSVLIMNPPVLGPYVTGNLKYAKNLFPSRILYARDDV